MGELNQDLSMPAFPRVERYLARLPRGIDSYPECTVKASLFRAFSESRSLRGFAWRAAHPKIAAMLRTPFAATDWLPQVGVMASILAVADHLRLDEEGTVAWFRECNIDLLSNRMYSALMSLGSPATLVKLGSARWGMLHRGIGFGITLRDRGADASVTYPPFLYSDTLLRGQGEALCTALSMSRAKDCSYSIVRTTPRSCVYRLDWT